MGNAITESEAMMTPPSGRTPHYDGDGCTGQDRTVDQTGAAAIRHHAKHVISRAHVGAWPEAVIHADWAADHYGTPGEYLLSTLLAGYARRSARPAPGPGSLPQLTLSIAEGDPEAAALIEYLADHRRLTGSPLDQCGALRAARLPLQTYVMFLHVGHTQAARRQWMTVYEYGRTAPLIPPAFATLLILWGARAALGPRRPATHTAPHE